MGRLGAWCFRRRWWVLAAWVLAVLAGMASLGPLFNRLDGNTVPDSAESVRAYAVLADGNRSAGTVHVLVDLGPTELIPPASLLAGGGAGAGAPTGPVDPATAAVATSVTRGATRLAGLPGVDTVTQPFAPGLPRGAALRLFAADRHGLLIVVTLGRLDRNGRNQTVHAIEAEGRTLAAALPAGSSVRVGGAPALSKQQNDVLRTDLNTAELVSLPLSLVVLVIVFGGVVAAGLPVLAAVVSVAASMTVLLGFSMVTTVDQDGMTVVTLLGLGLSVDYGLLLVARYREELAAGHPPVEAVARTWATAGRTILFSALTVAAAISGLLLFGLPRLAALGAAGVSIALVAMLVAITLTAALIGIGRRRIRPSRRQRAAAAGAVDRGFFAGLARGVQRRPWFVALGTGLVLLAVGAPLLFTNAQLPSAAGVPDSVAAKHVSTALNARFGQSNGPTVTVVARTTPEALDAYAARFADDPAVVTVLPAKAAGANLSSVAFQVAGDGQTPADRELVRRLRADRPAGLTGGTDAWVTGDAAVLTDVIDLIRRGLPAAAAVTLLAMLVLLFAFTGSLVIPIKAILANVISLGATLGVMTAVFVYGWGSGPLDTLTVGGLNPFVVVVVIAFAFGLSMDYEVFLLGRVREYVAGGADTDTAVRRGLQHTGRVITSAALLMVIVFGCFTAAKLGNIEQIGLGLTVAVLIDATIVRCLLVPATMTLLGRHNWWAPGPLRRLHARLAPTDPPERVMDSSSGMTT
ncbi:MMPL family transporter [Luedemannella helvata]|uniref:MMPL family transporter n=1 Tax=Luedemannella helvata TaxID=349315 RepID=A0ABN2JPN9_9ACTN